MTFKPMCMDKNKGNFGHSSRGYLLPCCWLDFNSDEDLIKDLYSEHLHLDNVDDIEEILLSPEWIKFTKSIQSADTASKRCLEYCSGAGKIIHQGKRYADQV